MSSIVKDTSRNLPWNMCIKDEKDMILWRIAVNLAEIADQLAEMNGYTVDSIYGEEEAEK